MTSTGGGFKQNNNFESTDTDESYREVKKPKKTVGRKTTGGGGRKPKNNNNAGGMNEEEDERKKIRRERNKLAAARCRKRRVELTDKLTEETTGLEKKRKTLQDAIQQYTEQKSELEFILESHLQHCTKSHQVQQSVLIHQHQQNNSTPTSQSILMMSNSQQMLSNNKPKRPTSLPVIKSEPMTLIPISTPSTGLGFDNLDWLPSTGLTPTATSATPLMTPNTINAVLSSLQTPTTNNKFTAL